MYTIYGKYKQIDPNFKESFTSQDFKNKDTINNIIENYPNMVYQKSNIKPITESDFKKTLNSVAKK